MEFNYIEDACLTLILKNKETHLKSEAFEGIFTENTREVKI